MDIRQVFTTQLAPSAVSDNAAASAARNVASAKSSATALETLAAVAQNAATPNAEQVKQAVKNINQSLATLSQGLEFSVDADSNSTVVKVVDQETQEVLRQMPSKEALEIARALDRVQGLLIKQKA